MAKFGLSSVHPSVIVKLVASIFIGLTAFGWFLVVIGFGLATMHTPSFRGNPLSYPFWVVTFFGPIMFITAVVNLIAAKLPHSVAIGRIAGATTAFLNTFVLTGLGMILYFYGLTTQSAAVAGSQEMIRPWVNLSFAGSLLATLFWTIVTILGHFYDVGVEKE